MGLPRAAACLGALAVALATAFHAPSAAPPQPPPPNELPRSWDLRAIRKAAPPYGWDGPLYVLAWMVKEDDRPLRVESCLVLKDLGEGDEFGRWGLAHLYRHPQATEPAWRLPPLLVSPPAPVGPAKAVAVSHATRLKRRPTNKELYAAAKEVRWSFDLEGGWSVVGCAVCERAWEAATGEKPTRFFGRQGGAR